MQSVLELVDINAENCFREVEMLSILFIDDILKNGKHPLLADLTEDVYRYVVVKAFALTLGEGYEALSGTTIHVTRDLSRRGWTQSILSLVHGSGLPMRVLSRRDLHSWLLVPDVDLWVDIFPPGSDVRFTTPVKYPTGPRRPGYEVTVDVPKEFPGIELILEVSKYLTKLSKENDPRSGFLK